MSEKNEVTKRAIKHIEIALEVLQKRKEYLEKEYSYAVSEISGLNEAIISLLTWREDLESGS